MKAEREAHEHRIANMNRRITDYHNKVGRQRGGRSHLAVLLADEMS